MLFITYVKRNEGMYKQLRFFYMYAIKQILSLNF